MVINGQNGYASEIDPRTTIWRHEYPFRQNFLEVRPGIVMHYVDEGPSQASQGSKGTVVMFHGNPTWSFYYRNLIKALSPDYRCIALDHIGCGLSSRPSRKGRNGKWGYRFTLANRIEDAELLLQHLGVEGATFVVHDWGGAIGMGVAGRNPKMVKHFVVLNTAAFPSPRIPLSINLCKVPVLGELMVLGGNGFARAAQWRAIYGPRLLPEAVRQGYLEPYNTVRRRLATLEFVHDIPMDRHHRSWKTLLEVERGLSQFVDHPMQIIWGDDDFCFTPHFRKEWQQRFPKAACVGYKDAGHYILEDKQHVAIAIIESSMRELE